MLTEQEKEHDVEGLAMVISNIYEWYSVIVGNNNRRIMDLSQHPANGQFGKNGKETHDSLAFHRNQLLLNQRRLCTSYDRSISAIAKSHHTSWPEASRKNEENNTCPQCWLLGWSSAVVYLSLHTLTSYDSLNIPTYWGLNHHIEDFIHLTLLLAGRRGATLHASCRANLPLLFLMMWY